LLTSNNQCSLVVPVANVLTYSASTGLQLSFYVPRGPQQKVLRDPIKRAKKPTIGPRPTVCRPLI